MPGLEVYCRDDWRQFKGKALFLSASLIPSLIVERTEGRVQTLSGLNETVADFFTGVGGALGLHCFGQFGPALVADHAGCPGSVFLDL